jgi:APA family basic amino acid/polyamine antiporter
MFVAFTGYARIATLGEEMRDPTRTIPRAIIATLVVSAVLYVAVRLVGIAAIGPDALAEAARTDVAPLVAAARTFDLPAAQLIGSIGAVTAMLGVALNLVLGLALNLVLGLSRMLLAMGRRGDMPSLFARVDRSGSPTLAVAAVAAAIAGLALIGNVELTWSFSAFTVLIYYAITNLAALRLPKEKQLYSPLFAWGCLAACLSLAFFVERDVWMVGLALIGAGLVWHALRRYLVRAA